MTPSSLGVESPSILSPLLPQLGGVGGRGGAHKLPGSSIKALSASHKVSAVIYSGPRSPCVICFGEQGFQCRREGLGWHWRGTDGSLSPPQLQISISSGSDPRKNLKS